MGGQAAAKGNLPPKKSKIKFSHLVFFFILHEVWAATRHVDKRKKGGGGGGETFLKVNLKEIDRSTYHALPPTLTLIRSARFVLSNPPHFFYFSRLAHMHRVQRHVRL
jgi:hypothetical protein